MSDIQKIFFGFGVLAFTVIIALCIYALFAWIVDQIRGLYYIYRYKHRFDKKPCAKCWCVDCKFHGVSGRCGLPGMSRYTPDDGFCYEAEPKEREGRLRL